jgi:hypothetical protein
MKLWFSLKKSVLHFFFILKKKKFQERYQFLETSFQAGSTLFHSGSLVGNINTKAVVFHREGKGRDSVVL